MNRWLHNCGRGFLFFSFCEVQTPATTTVLLLHGPVKYCAFSEQPTLIIKCRAGQARLTLLLKFNYLTLRARTH